MRLELTNRRRVLIEPGDGSPIIACRTRNAKVSTRTATTTRLKDPVPDSDTKVHPAGTETDSLRSIWSSDRWRPVFAVGELVSARATRVAFRADNNVSGADFVVERFPRLSKAVQQLPTVSSRTRSVYTVTYPFVVSYAARFGRWPIVVVSDSRTGFISDRRRKKPTFFDHHSGPADTDESPARFDGETCGTARTEKADTRNPFETVAHHFIGATQRSTTVCARGRTAETGHERNEHTWALSGAVFRPLRGRVRARAHVFPAGYD